jgi:phage baseplate assembly protein W
MAVVINRQPDYTDIDLDFLTHPTTGDVVKKSGNDAIKRSIRNLVFTNYYERPFRPWVGSGVRQMLFENATPLTMIHLKDAVEQLIRNFEPRVDLIAVEVAENIDENAFEVTIMYTIINTGLPVQITLFLERIR